MGVTLVVTLHPSPPVPVPSTVGKAGPSPIPPDSGEPASTGVGTVGPAGLTGGTGLGLGAAGAITGAGDGPRGSGIDTSSGRGPGATAGVDPNFPATGLCPLAPRGRASPSLKEGVPCWGKVLRLPIGRGIGSESVTSLLRWSLPALPLDPLG